MYKKWHRSNYPKLKPFYYNGLSKTWWVVIRGHKTGVFNSRSKALDQLKGYSGSKMKGFRSREAAESFWANKVKKV